LNGDVAPEDIWTWIAFPKPFQSSLHVYKGRFKLFVGATVGKMMREGVKAEDALRYSEPPDWILPARHSLGAALMQERRFAEAEQVYRDDLVRLPENGWALFGLVQSLHRQGKEEEAAATDARFQKIWSKADVQIKSSCLCQPGI
jgi:hypothetical protein